MQYAWTPKFQLSGPTVHSYTVVMRCVMRHARTPKFQLSGPTVHSLYCAHMPGNCSSSLQKYRVMNTE